MGSVGAFWLTVIILTVFSSPELIGKTAARVVIAYNTEMGP
jgi:hypothetical protein